MRMRLTEGLARIKESLLQPYMVYGTGLQLLYSGKTWGRAKNKHAEYICMVCICVCRQSEAPKCWPCAACKVQAKGHQVEGCICNCIQRVAKTGDYFTSQAYSANCKSVCGILHGWCDCFLIPADLHSTVLKPPIFRFLVICGTHYWKLS